MYVLDDYVQDTSLLAQLQDDLLWTDSLPYTWLNMDELFNQTEDPWIRLMQNVWQITSDQTFAGIEYWTNGYHHSNSLEWHYDKDEHLWNTQEIINSPKLGFVYYAHTSLPNGGYLEIQRENNQIERIEPVPNRLVIFDPSVYHRVEDVVSGTRRTVASNLWNVKPKEENYK